MDMNINEPPQSRTALILRQRQRIARTGILMTVLGLLAIILPVFTSYAVNFLIGVILTLAGLLAVLVALALRGTIAFVWALIGGLFPLCIGLFLLFFPTQGLVTITFLIALILLLTGVWQCLFAFDMRQVSGFGWVLFSGLVSVALGVWILVALSEASRVLLGVLLGIDLMSSGLSLILITLSMLRGTQAK